MTSPCLYASLHILPSSWQTTISAACFFPHHFLNLLNLSQLGFLAFPILGIVIPLAIWILKKDKVKNVDRIGKSILNFQITWTIVFFLTYLVWILNTILHLGLPLSVFGPVVIIATLYIFNILMIIINSVRCYKVKETYYQPALRILRWNESTTTQQQTIRRVWALRWQEISPGNPGWKSASANWRIHRRNPALSVAERSAY